MKDFRKGIKLFKENDFTINHELYESLSDSQSPHTLFISCSDSRVSPERLMQAYPGELFQLRNIANIVPPFDHSYENIEAASVIEFALKVLEVDNIIVCGHSNCGGCAAAINPDFDSELLPYTADWITQLHDLSAEINDIYPEISPDDKAKKLEQLNVKQQLSNLMTFPTIRQKVEQGTLTINGWHYHIGTGEIYIYNSLGQDFELG
ncbi:carbonic anhydrase [Fundicoccus sp. Sow4_H7]|uniref:carbonic anhydrase n=1 Tax=Fundicoccus sp. Sow4_H7 TaxID=3438784 RepID=UPI003F93F191